MFSDRGCTGGEWGAQFLGHAHSSKPRNSFGQAVCTNIGPNIAEA